MSNINRNKDSKKIIIMFLVVITVILCMIMCILNIFTNIKEYNNSSNIKVINESDIEEKTSYYSIEEILTSYDCKNIMYTIEKDKENNDYYKIILNFPYKLYEENESKKDYFDKVVKILNIKLNYSFELIDDKKNIDIYYDLQKKYYTINGIKDYYDNNAYLKVNNHEEISSIKGIEDSLHLNSIMSNNWDRHGLKLESDLIDEDQEFLYYENFKINYSDRNINYIEFENTYENNIYQDIKVGTDFDKIEKKLGKPTFKNGKKMIGYKDDDIYLFFYKDKVVVYPSSSKYKSENIDLEKKLIEYYDGKFEDGRSMFVKSIIDNYLDFTSEIVDDGVKVSSYLRGIEFYLYDDSSMKIIIYDNYKIQEELKEMAEKNLINLNYDTDSIYLNEINKESE